HSAACRGPVVSDVRPSPAATRLGQYRTIVVAGRHATAVRSALASIVGFWVVGPRRFRSWAVLVVWPRPVPRIGIPGVVIPQVVEGWPVGWVGAVFDDGVDAGQQAGEDVAVGEAFVGAVDEPDEQVGPQLVHPVWMPGRLRSPGQPVQPVTGGGDLVDGQVLPGQVGGAGLVAVADDPPGPYRLPIPPFGPGWVQGDGVLGDL